MPKKLHVDHRSSKDSNGLSSQTEAIKNHTKKIKCLLIHHSYKESNTWKKKNFLHHLQFSHHSGWIDETASDLILFITVFNVGNEKSASAKQGGRVNGITWGSLVLLGSSARRMH
jgi:hypothetical protein